MSKTTIQIICVSLLACFSSWGQSTSSLNLAECYKLARENYPLIRQQELVKKSAEFNIKNAGKAYLPQLTINGQASYQSTVTALPISLPGVSVPELSKDQYRIYAEINQPLYEGGLVRQQKYAQESAAAVEEQKLEIELYKIKERINQLFFGILLNTEQLKQLDLVQKDLAENLRKTEAAVSNGIALKSNADMLQAEQLKNEQRIAEIKATRSSFLAMLSLFIHKDLPDHTVLVKPPLPQLSSAMKRPELQLFSRQSQNLEVQRAILRSKNLPRLNLFLQAGYGRPALNMLSNKFEPYYIGGLRLNWNLNGLYTLRNDKALVEISRLNIGIQQELFMFNADVALKQTARESEKYHSLLETDEKIIELRSRILTAARAQLENGVMTAADFLRELNAGEQARENKIIHEVQLLMNQYNQQIITGE